MLAKDGVAFAILYYMYIFIRNYWLLYINALIWYLIHLSCGTYSVETHIYYVGMVTNSMTMPTVVQLQKKSADTENQLLTAMLHVLLFITLDSQVKHIDAPKHPMGFLYLLRSMYDYKILHNFIYSMSAEQTIHHEQQFAW